MCIYTYIYIHIHIYFIFAADKPVLPEYLVLDIKQKYIACKKKKKSKKNIQGS